MPAEAVEIDRWVSNGTVDSKTLLLCRYSILTVYYSRQLICMQLIQEKDVET